ncbi:MAG: helix-turn-helix transcriptional regulator [Deltaproteobacteria bacterium]|nr:helix-turn-helix transcriptional regulator [Deltaproteobacteria bacterium]
MAIQEKIGKRLREIRFSKGLTQKTMAQMAGVDYTYIGKIERAEQLPSLGVLIKISEALSLPLDRFIMDESTLRLINLLPGEGYRVVRKKEIWDLLKALENIHEEDIPLLIEIVSVLKKHREKRGRLPMVAELPEAYRKRKK